MVAGPNGSGKTTLIRTLRASREIVLPAHYINADDLKREHGLQDRPAQQLAEAKRLEAIAHGRSLMYETVMSHPSKIAELQVATVAGYTTTVIFVATNDPAINIERVALRVADGGHPVPPDRIRARHARSIALAPSAIALAGHVYIYDNTAWGVAAQQQLQAVLSGTLMQAVVEQPSPWVRELIEKVNARAKELEDLHVRATERGLVFPNLYASVCEGSVVASGKNFALQADEVSRKLFLHDKALLSKPVVNRQSYRIEYAQGVSKVTRRPRVRMRAVKRDA